MPVLTLTPLEPRDCPAAIASAGGVVYLLDGSGRQFRAFEESAALVPVHLAQSGGVVYVGAGVGGGPRLQARDYRTLTVLSDELLGDPASRTGVTVAAFEPYRSPLRALPHPSLPAAAADVARVQGVIDRWIPPDLAGRLAAAGERVLVHGGRVVTDLPEYAHLAGVETPAPGDGGRTYAAAVALHDAGRRAAVVNAAAGEALVLHELGHATEGLLTPGRRADWLALHAAVDWSRSAFGDYLLDPREAWAEAVRLWLTGGRQPDPRLAPFVVAALGVSGG
jgi:hypothetical protein